MELVDLGASGLRVSRVGLGCNNFGGRIGFEETRAVVEAALDAGITFFDTAESYGGGGGSERFLGELLEGRREQVVLATKFAWGGDGGEGRADNVHSAIAGSLERLRTDYVDLYYLHRPDAKTPIGETLGALDSLVQEGTVRAIGCSNFSAEQLAEADTVARELGTARFTVLQNQYSLLVRRRRRGRAPALPRARRRLRAVFPARAAACSRASTGAGSRRRRERASTGARSTTSAWPASSGSRHTRRSAGTRSSSSRSRRSPRRRASPRSSPARRSPSRCARTRPLRTVCGSMATSSRRSAPYSRADRYGTLTRSTENPHGDRESLVL